MNGLSKYDVYMFVLLGFFWWSMISGMQIRHSSNLARPQPGGTTFRWTEGLYEEHDPKGCSRGHGQGLPVDSRGLFRPSFLQQSFVGCLFSWVAWCWRSGDFLLETAGKKIVVATQPG